MSSDMPTEAPASSEIQALIAPFEDRWNHAEGTPESGLLRLYILRELTRRLHSEKSKLLSQGKKEPAREIRAWEDRIHAVREFAKLDGALENVLQSAASPGKRARLLPAAIYTTIPREEFERYDRQWEALLAAEACSIGWHFWSADAWIEIEHLEAADTQLRDRLWPHAIILYSESADARGGLEGAHWHGRWILLLRPTYKAPDELHVDFEALPGMKPKSLRWRLLFSARSR